jgi:hypothetical protein
VIKTKIIEFSQIHTVKKVQDILPHNTQNTLFIYLFIKPQIAFITTPINILENMKKPPGGVLAVMLTKCDLEV